MQGDDLASASVSLFSWHYAKKSQLDIFTPRHRRDGLRSMLTKARAKNAGLVYHRSYDANNIPKSADSCRSERTTKLAEMKDWPASSKQRAPGGRGRPAE
ncbi:hypothetical protein AXF42_Ash020281 [Apostasia shenzhenica]|uniref:Uncharacterized protein n=1 Tax=Apostasia shenzhenica TaxID=1088818 RepID=A0A2H9ZSX7_9ASPA|nr:hypothetical protein AXF42_Ash020279 [Apostasia shenzhenica]PKA46390.1 hypothetical protein AXF42_Ash020281 [Apostasia shenzhenica]